jgi:sarcosine oxidase, subunit gamma
MADSVMHMVRSGAFRLQAASERSVLRVKSCLARLSRGPQLNLPGCPLPDEIGAVTQGSSRVLTTGPGEWLLSFAPTQADRLRNVWAHELSSQGLALVDLTQGPAVLEVSGAEARDLLAGNCVLVLDVRRFPAGRCARTRFAQMPVVINCIQSSGTSELYVSRSYEPYLKGQLPDAAGHSWGAT